MIWHIYMQVSNDNHTMIILLNETHISIMCAIANINKAQEFIDTRTLRYMHLDILLSTQHLCNHIAWTLPSAYIIYNIYQPLIAVFRST